MGRGDSGRNILGKIVNLTGLLVSIIQKYVYTVDMLDEHLHSLIRNAPHATIPLNIDWQYLDNWMGNMKICWGYSTVR